MYHLVGPSRNATVPDRVDVWAVTLLVRRRCHEPPYWGPIASEEVLEISRGGAYANHILRNSSYGSN